MERRKIAGVMVVCAALLAACPVSLAQEQPAAEQKASQAEPRRLPTAMPARVQIDVYELRVPIERAHEFDVDALLPHAGNVGDLYEQLAKIGDVRLRHRLDQRLDLLSKTSTGTKADEPYIIEWPDRPENIDNLQSSCGLMVRFAGFVGGSEDRPCCDIEIALAGPQLMPSAEGKLYRRAETNLQYIGPALTAGPQLVYNLETAPAARPAEAIIYLARIVIEPIE
jgi:hypothetical protein